VIIEIDKRYFRPLEVYSLLGDASKARKKLGWKPKIKFKSLVKEMVVEDLKKISV
jgi:GDPmannose 4,6-dehydratase